MHCFMPGGAPCAVPALCVCCAKTPPLLSLDVVLTKPFVAFNVPVWVRGALDSWGPCTFLLWFSMV